MSVLRQVKQGLAYAKFESPDLNLAVIEFLNEVDKDLDDANYKCSDQVTEAAEELSRAIDETQVAKDKLAEQLAELEAEEREYDESDEEDEG